MKNKTYKALLKRLAGFRKERRLFSPKQFCKNNGVGLNAFYGIEKGHPLCSRYAADYILEFFRYPVVSDEIVQMIQREVFDSVSNLELTNRTCRALMRNGVSTISKLKTLSEEDIARLRGTTANMAKEISEALASCDLQEIPEYYFLDLDSEVDKNARLKEEV